MSTSHIVITTLVVLLGLGITLYTSAILRALANTRKPIPFDTGERARKIVADLPISSAAPTPAMDIYGPEKKSTPRPVILFVPGDGPEMMLRKAKDWALFRSYAGICAARGFLAAIANHRSSGYYKKTPAMVQDVADAVETLRGSASQYGIDPDRIIVWTFSGTSGAVLSRLLANPVPGVRGMISFYGMLDLSTYLLKVPEEIVQDYSLPRVLPRLDRLPCPIYLLNVGRDGKMITRGFENTRAALVGRSLPVIQQEYKNGRHGFEVLSPPEESRIEIDKAFAFIEDCLDQGSPPPSQQS